MTPSHSYGKKGGAHRYYVSSSLNRGKAPKRPDGIFRLPALPAERWVIEMLHRLTPDHGPLEVLARMEVHEESVHLALKAPALSEDERTLPLLVDRVRPRKRRKFPDNFPVGRETPPDHWTTETAARSS